MQPPTLYFYFFPTHFPKVDHSAQNSDFWCFPWFHSNNWLQSRLFPYFSKVDHWPNLQLWTSIPRLHSARLQSGTFWLVDIPILVQHSQPFFPRDFFRIWWSFLALKFTFPNACLSSMPDSSSPGVFTHFVHFIKLLSQQIPFRITHDKIMIHYLWLSPPVTTSMACERITTSTATSAGSHFAAATSAA